MKLKVWPLKVNQPSMSFRSTVKDAADMTFLIDDLKTGLRAGWKPVIAAMTVVVLMVIALTGSWELLGWNIDSTPDPDGGMLCIMVVCFYPVILMATYLFLRFSTGLAITAKTGAAVNISRAFALCAEYVPRGKAIRLAHLFALCVFGLPFLIMAAGLFLGLDWIAYVNLVEQTTNTITTSGSEKITTTGTKYSYSVASPIISWVQMISMPFVTGLFLIRFLRQMPTDIPVGSSKPSTN